MLAATLTVHKSKLNNDGDGDGDNNNGEDSSDGDSDDSSNVGERAVSSKRQTANMIDYAVTMSKFVFKRARRLATTCRR